LLVVPEPARRRHAPEDVPRYDPTAVERAYSRYRAQRQARIQRRRARRYARIRFFTVIVLLLALCVYIGLTAWRELERLFGI
jgi:hypothetical protein